MDRESWLNLMTAWGFGENHKTYQLLVEAYSQNHRYYHTEKHIDACLNHLKAFSSQLEKPHEVELAIWFHDAVYNPLSGKNEAKSADWAMSFLAENDAESNTISRVRQLIMVTEHDAPTKTIDESILVDVDLSILGSQTDVYDEFETAVRREYKFVPNFIYKKKRAAILQGFLDRKAVYNTELFIASRESQARKNLSRAINNLSQSV